MFISSFLKRKKKKTKAISRALKAIYSKQILQGGRGNDEEDILKKKEWRGGETNNLFIFLDCDISKIFQSNLRICLEIKDIFRYEIKEEMGRMRRGLRSHLFVEEIKVQRRKHNDRLIFNSLFSFPFKNFTYILYWDILKEKKYC